MPHGREETKDFAPEKKDERVTTIDRTSYVH